MLKTISGPCMVLPVILFIIFYNETIFSLPMLITEVKEDQASELKGSGENLLLRLGRYNQF